MDVEPRALYYIDVFAFDLSAGGRNRGSCGRITWHCHRRRPCLPGYVRRVGGAVEEIEATEQDTAGQSLQPINLERVMTV